MKLQTFCHVCGRPVTLTKNGTYRRHGYKMAFNSRRWDGTPVESGYTGIITKRPCWASGKYPLGQSE